MDRCKEISSHNIDKWVKKLEAFSYSGKSVQVWCTENNIKESEFYYWKRKIEKVEKWG